MRGHQLVIILLSAILPLLSGQLYFPDEKTGGFLQPMQSAPYPSNITNLRQSSLYESYVDGIISTGILKLSLAVNKALLTTSSNSYNSILYAPVGIAAALALVLLGSNGKTFEEVSTIMGLATGVADIQNKSQIVHEQFGRMLEKLQSQSGFDIGGQVNFATAVFVQENYPIRGVYQDLAESLYSSEVLNVNFKDNPENAKNIINAWVSERTRGKITSLLNESPSSATKVILASAMYFKAEWEKPFFEGSTKRRPFYINGRKSNTDVMVEMMSNGGFFPYYKDRNDLNCEILGLPYKGNHSTMYIVLPNNSNSMKLRELELRLNSTAIEALTSKMKYTGAVVLFPKMRIDSTLDLKKSLQLLGLRTLFNPSEANLGLLSPGWNHQDTDSVQNPISASNNNDILIFNRNGIPRNCSQIFDSQSTIKTCEDILNSTTTTKYKKFGTKIGRRVINRIETRSFAGPTLDNLRYELNQQNNAGNPGLYADNVIHKVYMDITESGTEAAATTSISLSRDGGRVTFRVDVPFLFFIMHEETKTVLFWGSINTPTPHF